MLCHNLNLEINSSNLENISHTHKYIYLLILIDLIIFYWIKQQHIQKISTSFIKLPNIVDVVPYYRYSKIISAVIPILIGLMDTYTTTILANKRKLQNAICKGLKSFRQSGLFKPRPLPHNNSKLHSKIYNDKKMLLHAIIPSLKRQIKLCRLLGFKSYKLSAKNGTLVETTYPKGHTWYKFLLIVVVSFALFVTFNGFYGIYRLSGSKILANNVGFASLVLTIMTSITIFADMSISLLTLRKSMIIYTYIYKFLCQNL